MAFVRVPGNPEPEGADELWLEGRGGVKVRVLHAPAQGGGSPRGSALVLPGRVEFIEKYFEVVRDIQARGLSAMVIDWRGQGLSDRPLRDRYKGHFHSFDDPAQDLADAVAALGPRLPRPHVMLSHSMGGAIGLVALQKRRMGVQAALFCAPMWGIANLSPFAQRAARALATMGLGAVFAPGVDRKWRREAFRKNPVTQDKIRHARAQSLLMAEPRLAIAGPTIGWVSAALDAMDGFQRPAALAHLRFPIAILSAGAEEIVDNDTHGAVAKLLPLARHVTIEGAKHEILMELDIYRAQLWAQFDQLLADAAAQRNAAAV